MNSPARPSGDQLLQRLQQLDRAKLRVYIGAAPGVGKTYTMLKDAHGSEGRGVDVVVGLVETYGRADTDAQIGDLEIVPRRKIAYRGVELEEMDVDAILARKPQAVRRRRAGAHQRAGQSRTRNATRTSSSCSTPASTS